MENFPKYDIFQSTTPIPPTHVLQDNAPTAVQLLKWMPDSKAFTVSADLTTEQHERRILILSSSDHTQMNVNTLILSSVLQDIPKQAAPTIEESC